MMLKVISLVSFALLLSLFVGQVYAQTETRDMDSLTTDYGNGTFKFESMPMWISNSTDYVPYILTENATTYKIETQLETLVFNKLGCNAILYNGTQVVLDSDSSIIHQKDLTTNSTWQYITDVNDAACTITIYEDSINNSITLESNKTSTNLATFSTKYIKNNDDNGFKLLLSVTNDNPSWTNNTMGFIETIHVPTNEVTLNGTVYNIPNNNGTFFDHNFFNNTQGSVIKLGDINYNYDTGLINLWGATLIDDNGISKITFDYSFNDIATPVNGTYEIDPTFGFTSGIKRAVQTVFQAGAACGAPNVIGGSNDLVLASSADAFDCIRSSYTVDITSIPDSATIDSVSTSINIFTAVGARVCDFNDLNTFPRSANPSALWTDIGDGTTFVDASSVCLSTGVKTFDLGAAAATDVQSRLVGNEWGVGIKYDNEVRDGAGHVNRFNSMSYQIIYNTPVPPTPQKPLNVDATNNRDGKIRLTWDANNATFVTNYDIFSADDYIGPFTLLDTIGNLTTFAHTGLPDNFEQYYKISAWFNPNGTNSTIVFGTSGNPFVNDTSNIETQKLWMGDDQKGYDIIRLRQAGTGVTCPDITGPSSVVVAGGSTRTINLFDQSDASGCQFTAYTMDRTTTPQFLLPQFFEDYLSAIQYLVDIESEGATNLNLQCEYKSVSNAGGGQIDPRINLTRAYQLAVDGSLERDLTPSYLRCASSVQQIPNMFAGDGGNNGVTLYRDSMAFNSSFFSFLSGVNVESRDTITDRGADFPFLQRFDFVNPTFSKIWNIQEHPKFDDESLTEAKAKETFDGKFNLNTFADNTDRGQIVMFKEFNKTQVGGTGFDTDNIITDLTQAELDAIFLSGQNTAPRDIFFSPNGTKMYMAGASSNEINQYNLNTAWVAAASFEKVISLTADVSSVVGVHFKQDGTKMYVVGASDDQIHEYDLSNSFDIATASFSQDFNLEPQSTRGLFVTEDGTKLYIPNGLDQNITQYDFGTAFDVSTLSFNQFLDVSPDIVNAEDVWFNPDGTLMFILEEDDSTDLNVVTYTLSTPFDISTASFSKSKNFSVGILNFGYGLFFRDDGLRMYLMTDQLERLTQYEFGINSTGADPNIRVTGTYQTNAVSPDVNLRFEIKDGGYAMGDVIGSSEFSEFFPLNEYDVYQDGGSLGVVHLSPSGTGIEPFDISLTPNWSNSTQDIFTVFIGLDDNSTSSSLSANITSFEIENTLKQDFEDLGYVQYYEVATGAACDTSSTGCIMGRPFYNSGLVQAEQVANPSVFFIDLPTPPTPTSANVVVNNDVDITLTWKQSLLNTTDFQISRESPIGGGFTKLADTNNVTTTYFDPGLLGGVQYNYEVCGLNGEQIGPCITASATTIGVPFDPPQNLVATDNLLTQIDLTWDAENATGVTGYTVFNSSTGSIPFDILGSNSDNSTTFNDLGLPNNFDMFYKVSAFGGIGTSNGTNSTVAMGSTIQPGQPVNIDNVNATAVLPFDVLLEWADSGINITDYQIERNGTLIVPSLLDAVVQFLRDDFSTYPDNATADLTWVKTIAGIDSADDIVGVNTTSGRIEFKTNTASSSKIVFDLEVLLGKNLTDNSGIGDFNMTWTHRLESIDSPPFNADTGEMKIILTDRDVTPTGIQTGITVGFFQREPASITSNAIRTAEDNNQFVTFEFIDNTCGLGSLTYQDTSPQDGVNDLDITVYSTLSKVGSFLEYKVGINPDYSGLGCVVSGTTTKTLDDIKLLKITRPAITAASIDHGWSFDDFAISTNGTLVKLYRDMDTTLGTNYLYDVSGINAPNGSLSIVGNPTASNIVKTNDVPSQIQNIVADLVNFFTLNQIELDWTQPSNGSGSPLGEGVSLNETKIFSRNITDGGPFILTTTLLAASPPPTEYNDTNIIVPNDYSYMLSSCNVLGCGPNSTEIFADSIDFPDAIFDLLFYNLNFNSLILNWTQPFLGGGSLQNGYQLNFTTPFAEPLTIIIADTGSSFTEYTVSGLTELTNYTFRVSAINQAGLNVTGLKLNVTTLDDFTEENFTVGFIGEFPDSAIDETNVNIIPIRFERIDLNATTVMLNVTYANNIDLACSFDYKFAMTESFFDKPLDTVSVGGGDQETSFLFLDFDNEVVDVFCWNEVANQTATISGSYILVQQNFPLLDQIASFRAGDFGTEGMFGILDMITLMVIIISMIGFNRVNETVGAIFNIVFIGALSFFGIIELSTTIFSAVALVLMLVIISTRKV